MISIYTHIHRPLWACCLIALLVAGGCQAVPQTPSPAAAVMPSHAAMPSHATMPRELSKAVLPTYRIEPPDILRVEAVHIVPRPPYRLRTLDLLNIQVSGTLPGAPIAGVFPVEPGGLVRLGARYGTVDVNGMTPAEAEQAIGQHLQKYLKQCFVSVTLAEMAACQQVAGEYLVGPDGTVTLRGYGCVPVVGRTVTEAECAIEAHLSLFTENPDVSVDVFAYNSKVYYVVTQGAGLGDGVYRFSVTGNETVLDAISQIQGLEQVSSKRIWIARPTREPGKIQVMPVDWEAITAQASTCTNYQILPGDRVFIAEDKWIAFDTGLAKIVAPFERIMGFTLLGAGTATRLSGPVLRGGGNPRASF